MLQRSVVPLSYLNLLAPAEHLPLQKQPFPDVYKKGLLKNFLKLTGNTCTGVSI